MQSAGASSTNPTRGYSCCIITNGARPEKLRLVIDSIHRQQMPVYEILVIGNPPATAGVIAVHAPDAAAAGQLGRMRNLGVAQARYDRIVILDDDILLGDGWYAAMLAVPDDIDIVTSRILLPDGTRYWDYSTHGGPRGHRMLRADDAPDEYVYMSGGTAWVLQRHVAVVAQWEQAIGFYQFEDVLFARQCIAAGFRIAHNAAAVAWHYDGAYTRIGSGIYRRSAGLDHLWLVERPELRSAHALKLLVIDLVQSGKDAEIADVLRAGILLHGRDPYFTELWGKLQERVGGDPGGDSWCLDGAPALRALLAALAPPGTTHTQRDVETSVAAPSAMPSASAIASASAIETVATSRPQPTRSVAAKLRVTRSHT
jgi:hypothetical protein